MGSRNHAEPPDLNESISTVPAFQKGALTHIKFRKSTQFAVRPESQVYWCVIQCVPNELMTILRVSIRSHRWIRSGRRCLQGLPSSTCREGSALPDRPPPEPASRHALSATASNVCRELKTACTGGTSVRCGSTGTDRVLHYPNCPGRLVRNELSTRSRPRL